MTNIARLRVSLDGFPGGPGVSTFYGLDGPTLATEVQALYNGLLSRIPADVSVTVAAAGDIIEDTTGVITGSWAGGVFGPQPGTATGNYAAPVGLLFRWGTAIIVAGRRVRGRTFFVPCDREEFTTTGVVQPGSVAAIGAALQTFVTATAGNFVIWNRPSKGEAGTPTDPARSPRAGSHAVVTTGSVSPRAAVLRSRRD